MSTVLVSYMGWAFLPDLVTGWLQSIFYAIFIRAGEPRPQPGQPRYVTHRRRIYISVVLMYLAYTLYEAHWEIRRASDHYELLNVSASVEDRTLQSRFRKLTLLYHPDKVNPSAAQRPAIEDHYSALLIARDTILDPVKRLAYDRFGPQALTWKCVTTADCMNTGLRALAPYYGASVAGLLASSYLGMLNWGSYWRWLAFIALATLEVRLIIRSDTSLLPDYLTLPAMPVAASLWPRPYLPFQLLEFAHKATISTFVALSRIGPVLDTIHSPTAIAGAGSEDERLANVVLKLEQLIGAGNTETARHFVSETAPFETPDGIAEFKDTMRTWIVTNTMRNDREVQQAIKRTVNRKQIPH